MLFKDIKVEKFPRVERDGRRLIWDSRQAPTQQKELVLLTGAPELKSRANAVFVGEKNSNADIEVENLANYLAESCSLYFSRPADALVMLGVTGTNGKTTCAVLTRSILSAAGMTVAEIGTLGLTVWQGTKQVVALDTGFTTPTAPMLQSLLRQLVEAQVQYVVMEVSSHALASGRVHEVDFDGALFTNLSLDHLDFHKTMQDYERAKTTLFTEHLQPSSKKKSKFAVINRRDPAGARILGQLPPSALALSFSLGEDCQLQKSDIGGLSLSMNLSEPTPAPVAIKSPLVGEFNAENLVGSWLLAKYGILRKNTSFDVKAAQSALKNCSGAPGRLQAVPREATDLRHVFVDYAHTPDALEKSLSVLKNLAPRKLWVVFGCGGDRDKSKRPLMGKIAVSLADEVILTSDNPRSEDPTLILEEIRSGTTIGTTSKFPVHLIENRREAISYLASRMKPQDVALLAGKGHEEFQIVGSKKLPFSDLDECKKALAATR